MLSRTARHGGVLLDFLAPALVSRVVGSIVPTRAKPQTLPPHANDYLLDKLKKLTTPPSSRRNGLSESQADIFNSTLARFRRAVIANDARAIFEGWQRLQQHGLLHLLRGSELGTTLRPLVPMYLLGESSQSSLDAHDRKLVEDMALLAAANQSTPALKACMGHYLREKEPEVVIELYERFIKSLRQQETWEGSEGENDETPSGKRVVRVFIPGRIEILLAVTTAYAMQDSFQAALRTYLATTTRFHRSVTKGFLKSISWDLALQKKVEHYVQRLDIARLVSRPHLLSKRTTTLSTPQSLKYLEKLYQAVLDGLSGPEPYIAPDPSTISPEKSVALSEIGWTSFLVAFLKCQQRDLAAKLWDDMAKLGVRPGVSMWTALLDTYDNMHAVDEALAGWNMMRADGIKPEALTYRALISTLFHGRKPEEAMRTFQTFQSEAMKVSSAEHILSVYNTVLHGLLYTDREEEAKKILQNMHDKGPKPDVVSYNTLLGYYGRRGDFKVLATLVKQMTSDNLVGDVFSFSAILSALLKVGREDAPELVLSIMRKHGVEPNVVIFTSIIDHQMQEQKEENLRAVIRMLTQMERNGIKPNEVTYTSILAGLYRGQWISAEKVEQYREEIIERMKRGGVKFALPAYHILIKACFESPLPEGLEEGLRYYQDMVGQKIPLVQTTWYILLAGLLHRGEWGIANEIVNEMYKTGFQPGGTVLELVSRVRKRTR